MIEFEGRDGGAFFAAFAYLHRAGVEPTALGGNKATVPDSTDWALVQQIAAFDGITVWTDLPEPEPAVPPVEETAKPAKRVTRRTKKES